MPRVVTVLGVGACVLATACASTSRGQLAVTRAQWRTARAIDHVRLTGAPEYEVRSLVRVDPTGVTALVSAAFNQDTIDLTVASATEPIRALRPGRSIRGTALAMENSLLVFLVDGRIEPWRIPQASIGTVEVAGRAPRSTPSRVVGSVLIGVGAFIGLAYATFAVCGWDCPDGAAVVPLAGAGILAGLWGADHRAWQPVTTAWLVAWLSGDDPASETKVAVPIARD